MSRGQFDPTLKIVVSGIGIVSPLGNGREKTWSNLLAGKSGIQKTQYGLEARVHDFSMNGARSRMGDFALLAAEEAFHHAQLDPENLSDQTIGCTVSQSKPILNSLNPELLLASFMGWSAGDVIRKKFKFDGPASNVVAASATGVASIDLGASWIRAGLCDIVLAGAAESSLTSIYHSGFQQMGVLAQDEVRPFDKNRSGFAMGEGAAVLVLESEVSAQARGHKPLAILGGVALQQSAADLLRFDSDGSVVARLLKSVLKNDAIPQYINAHGTATQMNDVVETRGIKIGLKEKSAHVKISSTKAATGHLLGAAGAVEAAFAVLAIRDQLCPPTLNLSNPDPECDLDYTVGEAKSIDISRSVSLSYGFGGQMGAVLFERVHG